MQLIRICLLPPTTRCLGGHRTGSVACRSTFFIFRIPLMVAMVGLEPTRPLGHLILSQARLPIPSHRHMCGFCLLVPQTRSTYAFGGRALPLRQHHRGTTSFRSNCRLETRVFLAPHPEPLTTLRLVSNRLVFLALPINFPFSSWGCR